MDSKMTPEYKVISEQVEKIIKGSNLPEVQKYSLLAGCMTKVAHEYNGTNFEAIKVKLALVSKTMLNAVEKAEKMQRTEPRCADSPLGIARMHEFQQGKGWSAT